MPMRLLIALFVACSTSAAAQPASEPRPLPVQTLQTFAASYDVLLKSYVTPLEGATLVGAAIQGMLRAIDPDGGEYWTAEDVRDSLEGPPPGTGSIGANLHWRHGAVVLSPMTNGPAREAGIRFGDQLRSIDDIPVGASSAPRLLRLLQGPAGSSVVLGIYRAQDDRLLTIPVRRAPISPPMPSLTAPAPDIRVLRMPALSMSQLDTAFSLLRQAWLASEFAGLALDLRENQGGQLDSAIALAAAFLPRDSIIATLVGRDASGQRVLRASPADYMRGSTHDPMTMLPEALRKLPLVLMVDGQTASGAEIVVAALKDNGRARVVGRPTFGRGSVQTMTRLPDGGAIRYTTGHWVSPSGRAIDRHPIQPDQLVELSPTDADLSAAVTMLRTQRGHSGR